MADTGELAGQLLLPLPACSCDRTVAVPAALLAVYSPDAPLPPRPPDSTSGRLCAACGSFAGWMPAPLVMW